MKNGRPETYREIVAIKNAHSIEKYVTLTDPQLIPEIFQLVMQSPANKVTLNNGFLTFTNYKSETEKVLPVLMRAKVELLVVKRDAITLRLPGERGRSFSDSSSSSNNNNNNNNNNG